MRRFHKADGPSFLRNKPVAVVRLIAALYLPVTPLIAMGYGVVSLAGEIQLVFAAAFLPWKKTDKGA